MLTRNLVRWAGALSLVAVTVALLGGPAVAGAHDAWAASWSGTGPGVPAGEQQLDGVVMDSTTYVPVRESQALVKGSF